jgi:hypothetical protein
VRGRSSNEPKIEARPTGDALQAVIACFNKWHTLKDVTPVYVMLGTAEVNLLRGDPVWLGLIAPVVAQARTANSISRLSLSHRLPRSRSPLCCRARREGVRREGRAVTQDQQVRHHDAEGFRLDPVDATDQKNEVPRRAPRKSSTASGPGMSAPKVVASCGGRAKWA